MVNFNDKSIIVNFTESRRLFGSVHYTKLLKITYTGSVQVSSALSTDRRTRATIS